MDSESVDEKTQQYILQTVKMPFAILKNVNVDNEYKGQGFGSWGVSTFMDKVLDDVNFVLLVADTGESNAFSSVK